MKLVLNRILKTNEYTIGELNVDGNYICDTLEDTVRPLPETCPNTPKGIACKCEGKVYGKTAVPAGTYKVKLGYSSRFKRILPQVLSVPHFIGILIHSLNKSSETEGCIGVGTWDGKTEDWISDSRKNFNKLFAILKEADSKDEEITITINNL